MNWWGNGNFRWQIQVLTFQQAVKKNSIFIRGAIMLIPINYRSRNYGYNLRF